MYAAALSVIEERIHSLLKHSFFIPDDEFRRFELDQLLQPVIPVDDPPVQVVQVRSGKTPSVQPNERPEVRGYDGDHIQDHPLWAVTGGLESFEYPQPFGMAEFPLLGCLRFHQLPQFIALFVDIDPFKNLFYGLGPDGHFQLITELFLSLFVLLFG